MKILVVDDSIEITEMMSTYFTLKGDLPDVAHDGEEGVKKIQENEYDVIILDLAMPKSSGFDTLEKLKNKNILQPEKIFVVTAMNITNTEKQRIEKYGVKNLIIKPMKISELYSKISVR